MTVGTPDLSQIAIAHSIELEKAVLGGIMLEPQVLPLVMAKLDVNDFYYEQHKKIYRACLELNSYGIEPGFYEVYELVGDLKFDALAEFHDAALPGSVEYLCTQIKDYARRRAAQKAMMDSIASLGVPGVDLAEQFEFLSNDFAKLLRDDVGIVDVEDQVVATLKRIENQTPSDMLQTGYRTLDSKIGGMQLGEYWIIAGRPSVGKSALASNFAINMARKGYGVLDVSVEGTNHAKMCRLLSIYSGIPLQRIRTGALKEADYPRLAHSSKVIAELTNYRVCDSESRWEKIKANIQHAKLRDPNLKVVFIDYIQLLSVGTKPSDNRTRELEYISGDAKRLAAGLKIVMMMVCQLNREVEKRKDHRPMLSDLKQCGALEQDADVILFPYRPAYYGESKDEEEAEIAIAKNRDGATGTVEMRFHAECVRFSEPE